MGTFWKIHLSYIGLQSCNFILQGIQMSNSKCKFAARIVLICSLLSMNFAANAFTYNKIQNGAYWIRDQLVNYVASKVIDHVAGRGKRLELMRFYNELAQHKKSSSANIVEINQKLETVSAQIDILNSLLLGGLSVQKAEDFKTQLASQIEVIGGILENHEYRIRDLERRVTNIGFKVGACSGVALNDPPKFEDKKINTNGNAIEITNATLYGTTPALPKFRLTTDRLRNITSNRFENITVHVWAVEDAFNGGQINGFELAGLKLSQPLASGGMAEDLDLSFTLNESLINRLKAYKAKYHITVTIAALKGGDDAQYIWEWANFGYFDFVHHTWSKNSSI